MHLLVCLSICLSHTGIEPNLITEGSWCFHHQYHRDSRTKFYTQVIGEHPPESFRMEKNADFQRIMIEDSYTVTMED